MEKFTSPRLLPCFHTFCLGCLKRLVGSQQKRTGSFPCPTCRTTVNIPRGGVEKFQVNFYIEAEVESSGSVVRTCDMCSRGPATHKCTDCDQFACDTCTAIHASITVSKSHTVLSLQNTKTAGKNAAVLVTKERYCSTHKEEKIRFFCTKCSTVICRDCKLTSHERHATTDLSEKSSEAKQLVLKVTERSRNNLEPQLRQALQEAQNQRKKVEASKKTILGTLERRAEELKREIDESLTNAKQKLNQETADVDKIASQCIDTMTQELACFLSLIEHAQCVTESGCDADVLEVPNQLKQFFGTAGTSVSAAARNQDQYGGGLFCGPTRLASSRNQLTLSPNCKLKSFTSDKWRVDVQLEDKDTLKNCENCSNQYNKNADFCPKCRNHNLTRTGLNRSYNQFGVFQDFGAGQVLVQCKNCRSMYVNNSHFCPSCGTAESESSTDVLASIQRAILRYIGEVSRLRHSQDDTDEKFGEYYFQSHEFFGIGPSSPVSVGNQQSSGKSTTSQISTQINAIQSLLSSWQGL